MKKEKNKMIRSIKKRLFSALFVLTLVFLPLTSALADEPSTDLNGNTTNQVLTTEDQGPLGDPEAVFEATTAADAADMGTTSIEAENDSTGAGSENINEIDTDTDTTIETDNDADTTNDANLKLDSGNNDITDNTTVNNITTGDVNSAVNLVNVSNMDVAPGSDVSVNTIDGSKIGDLVLDTTGNPDQIIHLPSSTDIDLGNNETGCDSENENIVTGHNSVLLLNNNDADTDNTINIDANTGLNDIERNTLVGNVLTGDANLATSLINLQNFINPNMLVDIDIYSILNGLIGDIVAANDTTGADSDNSNLINGNTDIDQEINNNATTSNNINYDTNTGKNDITANSAVGSVTTGDTNIQEGIFNWSNTEELSLYIINVFGNWTGSVIPGLFGNYIINQLGKDPIYNLESMPVSSPDGTVVDNSYQFDNSYTGPDSNNTNVVDQSTDLNEEINNNASVNNIINILANTGKNLISKNTQVGNIETGSINLMSNIVNILNSFGNRHGRLNIKIINIFGDWCGNLGKEPEVIPPPVIEEEPVEEIIVPAEVVQEPIKVVKAAAVQKPVAVKSAVEFKNYPTTGNTIPLYYYFLIAGCMMSIFSLAKFADKKIRIDRY